MHETKIEMKGGIDNLTIIVGDFNILLSIIDKITKQKVKKKIKYLNNTVKQWDLTQF